MKRKKLRLAINGFGRVGRIAARIAIEHPQITLAAINSRSPSDSSAYLLKYDSVYGTFPKKISSQKNFLSVNNQKIAYFQEEDLKKINWSKADIDIVIDATGKFRTSTECQKHLKKGVKLVIISAPAKDKTPTYILGVNEKDFNPLKEKIISNSSCTTNCLGPVLKVLDENFQVKRGFMTTVHSWTRTQNLLDGSSKKDFRFGRAGTANIIPASTGAAKDIGKVLPHLKGKIICQSLRVPLLTVSLIDLIVETEKKVNISQVNSSFKKASQGDAKGILEITEEELVSSDLKGPHSAMIDSLLTKTDGYLVKICAWYDNEWGYVQRLIDMTLYAWQKITG
ncbi:type I glyceraldehyde-3-phosphate dehydrogenase [Candidatus Microgenomates bacterium]|nr:type I glyceraldehyde-3-phosphate dehydrogenase [Candidatus Microgenomates bacterium]